MRELRQAGRSLFARPLWTCVVLLTLALGLGANGAVWTLAHAVFLEALPYPEAERLVVVESTRGGEPSPISFPNYRDLRDRLLPSVLEEVAVFALRPFVVKVAGKPHHVEIELVSASYFDLLGHEPWRGRRFGPEEEALPRGQPVVVVSQTFWQRHFTGQDFESGTALLINDQSFELIGVMPPEFHGLSEGAEMWIPVTTAASLLGPDFVESRLTAWFEVAGRLAPEVGVGAAQEAGTAVMSDLSTQYPEANRERRLGLRTLRQAWFGDLSSKVQGLAASALLVFLLAGVNVSCLLWARTVERRREIALRTALGASRGALVRRLLLESLILAFLGGLLALVFVRWVLAWLLTRSSLDLRSFVAVETGPAVVLAVLALSALASLFFGALPALGGTRLELARELAEGGGGGARRGRRFDVLVMAEVALAFVLLYAAFFAAERFERLAAKDLGFNTERLLTARVNLSGREYLSREARLGVGQRLLNELRGAAGVEEVALMAPYLPGEGGWQSRRMTIENWAGDPELASIYFRTHRVSSGFFEMAGLDLLDGRAFDLADAMSSRFVAVVSASAAERCWPGESPVGRRVKPGAPDVESPMVTVVGVVEDLAQGGFVVDSDLPDLYFFLSQVPPAFPPTLNVLLRTAEVSDAAAIEALRETVDAAVPDLPTYDVRTMDDRLAEQLAGDRFLVRLVGFFTLLAMFLAAAGIYGLMSYRLARRSRELGIRLALGSQRRDLFAGVLGRAAGLALRGCAAGGLLVFFASRGLEERWQESFLAPSLLVGVAILAVALSLLATALPAWRASRLDPVMVLREE